MTKQQSVVTWRQAVAVYTRREVMLMAFLGFAAGLPLLMVFSTLTAWLRDMGVSTSTIGFFGWVGITYSIKVFWAPVVDRLRLPVLTRWLGIRRSWMLLGQVGIACGLAVMASLDPKASLTAIALSAVLVAFSSSTQDIALDAFRIESAVDEYQGAMSASYIFGYRLAMLVAGAGALFIADWVSWPAAYWSMAGLMSVGVLAVLIAEEPSHQSPLQLAEGISWLEQLGEWFQSAVIAPLVEFFQRNSHWSIIILLFIGLFRVSDITMGIMANPFYLDLGFTKSEIASIGKVFGFAMTMVGAFGGGLLVVKYGIFRPLILGAIMVASTNLLFVQLAGVGADILWLAIAISGDNISGGLSNAVFVAYLSSLTNREYTATQYALFSSLMTLPGKFFSGFSGLIVDAAGYAAFFSYAATIGIPAIILAWVLWRANEKAS